MHLYINTPGCRISVQQNEFMIKPPEGEIQRVPVGRVTCLYLQRSATISAEVAFAAAANDVDIQFVERNGKPVARLWINKFGSISVIRKQQLAFSRHAAAVSWVQEILAEKVANQGALLLSVQGLSGGDITGPASEKISALQQRILALDEPLMQEAGPKLRPLEAAASKVYFQTLSQLLPAQYRFERRSQHPAADMFNAMLNYAYGILYGRIEGALIRSGIDPYVGIFHRDEYNKPVFTFDVIERFRCWADFVVTRLCQQEVIFIEFFEVENGAFWLNAYGKRILIQAFEDYLNEVVAFEQLQRSRNTHLELAAQKIAAFFKSGDW